MTNHYLPGLAIAGLLMAAAPALATTTVLDFSGNICGGGCVDGSAIDGDYGTTANVAMTWVSRAGLGPSDPVANFVRWWGPNYGGLNGVAYSAGSGTIGEVTFTVADGFELTLDSLDGAGWPNSNRTVALRVYDLSYNELLFTTETFPGQLFLTVNFGVTTSSGLILQWGPDSFNGGIDNLTFTVRAIGGPPPGVIPEPATWGLMIAGFGMIGLAARRRRQVTA